LHVALPCENSETEMRNFPSAAVATKPKNHSLCNYCMQFSTHHAFVLWENAISLWLFETFLS